MSTERDEPVGYFLAREILGTAEVLNLAVVPERRGQGLGGVLLDAGLAAVRARGGSEVFLEVRASNAVAQALYAARGFRIEGRRRGYYRRPRRGRAGASPAHGAVGVEMMAAAGHWCRFESWDAVHFGRPRSRTLLMRGRSS